MLFFPGTYRTALWLGHCVCVDQKLHVDADDSAVIVLQNDEVRATFCSSTGALQSIQSLTDGVSVTANHTFATYTDIGNAYQFAVLSDNVTAVPGIT